ncbi:hypothetical protein JN085_04175, partial [Mycolicibacterium austroafricanum]
MLQSPVERVRPTASRIDCHNHHDIGGQGRRPIRGVALRKSWLVASAAVVLGASVPVLIPAPAHAICGSIGGVHVDVTGCADPLYELNYMPPPPPPPRTGPRSSPR